MARNITTNRVSIEGNTVPRSVRHTTFRSGGSVINLTVVTQTDIYEQQGGKWVVSGQKPEYHNAVIRGGSEKLADILKERSLFVRVEGELHYRDWERAHRVQVNGQWTDLVVGGQTIMVKTPVAEIIVAGNKSEFRIMPCVNSRDNAATRGQGAHAGSSEGSKPAWDEDDDLGPAFPSEASGMDDVPF